MSAAPTDARDRRKLTALPAIALVVGSMLGIGIFIMPPQVAANVSGPWPFLAMWIVGGLAALFGALCLAELGAMRPRSGGDYEFLHIGWGHGIAFAAGWLQLLVIFPGSLASVAVATAKYQFPVLLGSWAGGDVALLGLTISAPRLTAAALVLVLTLINHYGVRIAGWLQVMVTVVPILVLLIVSVYVLGDSGGGEALRVGTTAVPKGASGGGLSSLGHAYLKVYFAYSGWNAALYVAGEIKEPGRNIPRALVGGTGLVTGLYVLLCLGFLSVFGFAGLPGVGEAGTAAAVQLFGDAAVTGMALLILLAMIGSLNGTVLIGSRIAYAMAGRGDCVAAAGRLHPRHGTPHVALWLQAAIAVVLIFSPFNLDQLINYTSSAMLITGTLTVLSVMILRRRQPELRRPYKTWLYPWPPVLYAVSSLLVLVVLAQQGDLSVWIAAGWFAAALLFHRVTRGAAVPVLDQSC
jgi:APA family basic amino acid/polyamine antiporter